MTELLTNSRRKKNKVCAFAELIAYVCGLKPSIQTAPLRIGGVIHDSLEAYKKAKMKGVSEEDATALSMKYLDRFLAAELGPDTRDADDDPLDVEYEYAAEKAMLTAYFKRWKDDQFEYVSVEEEFEVPFMDGWNLAGKRDGIIRIKGKLWLLEHKTSSFDIGDNSIYWRSLRINSQINHYLLAAQLEGMEIEGVIYDVIKKPTADPKRATPKDRRKYKKDGTLYAYQRDKSETVAEYTKRVEAEYLKTPDEYFKRKEIRRQPEELREAHREIAFDAQCMAHSVTSKCWPKNDGLHCNRCECQSPCMDGLTSEDLLAGFVPPGFAKGKKHAELKIGD